MFKNVASQKVIFFAFDSTTNLPKTGDGANITPYVSKDYGTVTVLGTTTATELDSTNAKGYYSCVLTQAETNADTLMFTAKSSTANIVVIGSPAVVMTNPVSFTSLTTAAIVTGVWTDTTAGDFTTSASIGKSIMNGVSLGTGLTINAYTGNTVQTGDAYARLGAPAGASVSADVAAINAKTTNIPSSPASTTNITAGTITTVTNLTNAPTAGDFTATMKTSIGTAVAASAVASVTGSVGSVVGLTASNLDASVSSRLATSGYTSPPSTSSIASAVYTGAMTESYAAQGAGLTLAQGIYQLVQQAGQMSISGTTETVKKRDGSTTAKTFTLDSATAPTTISETT